MRTKGLWGSVLVTAICITFAAAILVLCRDNSNSVDVDNVSESEAELLTDIEDDLASAEHMRSHEINMLASGLRTKAANENRYSKPGTDNCITHSDEAIAQSKDASELKAIADDDVPLADSINIEETAKTGGVKEIEDSDVPLADNIELGTVPSKWLFALAGIVIAVILVFGMLWLIE